MDELSMNTFEIPLPPHWGLAQLYKLGSAPLALTGVVRSYDSSGNVLIWQEYDRGVPAAYRACDVEQESDFCGEMAALLGVKERNFHRSWVFTEVLAKLLNIPILIWLKRFGLIEGSRGKITEIDASHFGAKGRTRIFTMASPSTNHCFGFGYLLDDRELSPWS